MSGEAFDLDALGAIPDPLGQARRRVDAAGGSGGDHAADGDRGASASWDAVAAKLAPSRTRRQVRREHVIALGLAVLWLATVAVIAGLRPHYEALTLVVQGGVPMALSLLALALALSGGKLGFGVRPNLLVATLALAPVIFGAVVIAFPVPLDPEDVRSGVDCGLVELFSAVVPGLALVYAHRRGTANGAGLRMAVLGLAVGMFAAGMWAFHCPDSSAVHVLISHGLPAIGIAAATAALAAKLGRIR